jgi:hypothetical protein
MLRHVINVWAGHIISVGKRKYIQDFSQKNSKEVAILQIYMGANTTTDL